MKERLQGFLLVMAVGAAVAIGAKYLSVPYNVALVVVGLFLVFVDVLPHASMDPQVILVLFLPLLVFEAALFSDAKSLRRASRPILALAIPGVVISLIGTAAVAAFALALPFSAALLLGAVLSITDTISVVLAFRSVRVPHRLHAIMEGESLFNDGTALVLVSVTSAILLHGVFDPVSTLRTLLVAILGGVAVGSMIGALGAAVLRRTPDHLTAILASIVLVLGTSALAEEVHASPVIAVVVAGLFVGNAARSALEPSRVLALQGFWEVTGFVINVLLFLRVGMQLDPKILITEAPSIALALVALHLGRAVAVYGCFLGLQWFANENVPRNWQHIMVVGNIKGALSMAAVLALPHNVPYRHRLIAIVFGATLVTMVTQALPFRRFLHWFKVVEGGNEARMDAARASLIAARRGQLELDDLLESGLLSRRSHAERRAQFQRRIIAAEAILHEVEGERPRDRLVDTALLYAQKASVLDAARRGLVPEPIANAEVERIDSSILDLELNHDHDEEHGPASSAAPAHGAKPQPREGLPPERRPAFYSLSPDRRHEKDPP
ncbi:MAG TPA: sodium:proton antiporter [Polyangiaceae bacterium]|nr:sodium:proton antiporter [Polyangiaceae bacterium]